MTRPLLAACLLALPVPAFAQTEPAAAPAVAEDTTWAVLSLGDERIGWARTTVEPRPGGAGTRTDSETSMAFRRFGQRIEMAVELTTEEDPAGDLQSFTLVTKNPGAAATTATGTRDGDVLRVVTAVGGGESTRDVELPPDLKSPSFLDALLTGGTLEPGEPVEFKSFFPELGEVGTVTVTRGEAPEAVELPTGETRDLTPVTVTQDVLPFPTTVYVDAAGEAVFETMDFLGQPLTTFEVSKEEALRALFAKADGGGADMGFDTLVAVTPIPNVHETTRVVYEVKVEGADAAALFPTTDSQTVEPLDDGAARVTVAGLPVVPTATAGEAPELTRPTRYLQSDDPRVIAHANAAAPADAAAGAVAAGCAEYVRRVLTNKNFSTALASAAEVAENLSGDCTEHSVLCGAMLRARGVPARVCVGLVTIPGRGRMGGHMWVEALLDDDGPGPAAAKWVPLDPTITGGGIGGGHLLLSRSDLSDADASPVASFLPMLEVIGRLTVGVSDSE